jgi:hypothetical protein
MKLVVGALAVVALSAFLAGCTTTQKVMTGGAMGGVTGFALADRRRGGRRGRGTDD